MTRVVVAVRRDLGRHFPGNAAFAHPGFHEDPIRVGRTEPDHFARRRNEGVARVGTDSGLFLHQAVLLSQTDVPRHQGSPDERHPAQRAAPSPWAW